MNFCGGDCSASALGLTSAWAASHAQLSCSRSKISVVEALRLRYEKIDLYAKKVQYDLRRSRTARVLGVTFNM